MFGGGRGDDQVIQWTTNPMAVDRRWKANIEVAPNCPRCASANTKFCYYNNYSLSQPRYFCKGCRRYWTKGGSLRNVPVGGGCRKSRRAKPTTKAAVVPPTRSSASPSSSSAHTSGHQPDSEKSSSNESNGADIDMAAVFARFLNHGSSSSVNTDDGVNSTESQQRLDSSEQDYQQIQRHPDLGMTHEINQLHNKIYEGIDIVTDDCITHTFNHVMQDDEFWPEVSNSNSWQSIAELQELDDQFKISTNLGDAWSFPDMMSYEIFPRPAHF
ncbi:hypothetical protein Droror1_Dr00026490 [Drosera rotundifolia]